ncbi:MAG TPA: DUF2339 domain-containing protein [Bryobacteraceae bacterium]|nr:DUF2339 domain-containing protein [Bryobacteraceae bacterium]
MEIILFFGLVVVLVIRWAVLKGRMEQMESRIAELTARVDVQSESLAELYRKSRAAPAAPSEPVAAPVAPHVAPAPVVTPQAVPPHVAPPQVAPPKVEPPRVAPPPLAIPKPQPAAAPREWETILGGSWLNKLGVFVLVVGLALLLRYSFTQFGPLGRVIICLAASLSLLAGGALLESKDRYQIFARGLLGGGWAALYVTVYAMHAVEAARVIDSAAVGAILLLAVATGMIVHSLKYRSQTVSGLAYFIAFGTLAITDMTSLPFLALVPLAASLLYVTHRFQWTRMALLGLIATYAVVVIRGDTGAPLWQAQTIFTLYWLLFEIFDVMHPEAWLLALNAAGALGLSVMKWQTAAPGRLWILLAAAAGAYLLSAAARIRSHKWHGAATLTAALAAAAIFQKLDHQWVATALVVEAELFYLAGIRLRAPYLRWLGTSLFGVEVLRLLVSDLWVLPLEQWVPVASLDAVVFYANRALYAADFFYGYAAAGMLALLIGKKTQEPYRSVAWQAAAAGVFAFGWWRRLFDFRLQGYLLLVVGLAGTALETRELPLAVAAAVCYAAVLCTLGPGADRFVEDERTLVQFGGACAAVAALMALVWRLAPGEYLGAAWMALALFVLELGLRRWPEHFRRMAYVVALAGVFRVWWFNVGSLHNNGPWEPRLMPLWAALLAYAIAARARREEGGVPMIAGSTIGLALAFVAMWALLPVEMVGAAWAAAALVLLLVARQWKNDAFEWQCYAAAAFAYFLSMARLPDTAAVAWPPAAAIGCFYAAQLVSPRDVSGRLYFSLLATTLTTMLLYYRISGSLLTMACGIQGVILLASGFPLRDRVLRISGLALLLGCILKLFVWDLRHLETLPRIFSFIVLGVILLGVSWVYTRFRERVAKLL